MQITDRLTLLNGDCLAVMRDMPDASVDSVVCDPPYGLSAEPDMAEVMRHWMAGDDYVHTGSGFMGKSWDSFVPGPSVWREALRVLKPGGHLAAFFGTRTYDIGTLAIRLAGFEVRDQLAWVYGSGFPKSLNVSKAIEAVMLTGGSRTEDMRRVAMGEDYEPSGRGRVNYDNGSGSQMNGAPGSSSPVTPEAARWAGWGTALKPAWEPICLARKPLIGTVASNVLAHGTGGLNIDGCRVPAGEGDNPVTWETPRGGIWTTDTAATSKLNVSDKGRFPANLIHDGSDEVLAGFPDTGPSRPNTKPAESYVPNGQNDVYGKGMGGGYHPGFADTSGSAARFFYCAKASRSDRQEGNDHPTVKPTALMAWLARLVTPPGGLVLDPFMGSGSTGKACHNEGFRFVGVERDPDYFAMAVARIWDHVST